MLILRRSARPGWTPEPPPAILPVGFCLSIAVVPAFVKPSYAPSRRPPVAGLWTRRRQRRRCVAVGPDGRACHGRRWQACRLPQQRHVRCGDFARWSACARCSAAPRPWPPVARGDRRATRCASTSTAAAREARRPPSWQGLDGVLRCAAPEDRLLCGAGVVARVLMRKGFRGWAAARAKTATPVATPAAGCDTPPPYAIIGWHRDPL